MSRIIRSLAAVALTGAVALPAALAAPPAIGNRANGLDYQPTPSEIATLEKADSVQFSAPSHPQLENIDRNLLREEGASTTSVPDVATHP